VKLWRGFKRTYRKILFRFSDRFVAFSGMAEEFLEKRGVPEDRIETQIQVMPEELLPEPEENSLDEKYSGKKMILSLGYLEERKGVQDLIQAFREIQDQDYRLVIAGTGPYEEELKNPAEGDDRIEFVGYLSEQEKANYFDAADLFVLPTHHDPWGLVINEALHYGTPVVTTESAGAKELISDTDIIEEGDTSMLKEKLQETRERPESEERFAEGLSGIRAALEEFE
jgi:glycosyltransferase involved in cell wall biosynthesis